MKTFVSFTILILLAFLNIAQTEVLWDKTYGGSKPDFGYSGQQTADGGYIITGSTLSAGSGLSDVWLIKTDAAGVKQWEKTFGGSTSDTGYSVKQTADGGYIITGETNSYGAGSYDIWLIKTDASGVKQWDKTFGGSSSDKGMSVQQTTDNGYIITGLTYSYGTNGEVWLVKTDASGVKQWDKTFGATGFDEGYSVQLTSDGGYIISGETGSYGAGSSDVWLIKTDASGVKQWDKTFGGISIDKGMSVQQTTDNGYIIGGITYSYGTGGDFWLVKTDATGIKQWDKYFGGTNLDEGYSVEQTTDGGYILMGKTASYGAGETDIWVVKTDTSGNKQWDKTFGGTSFEEGYSVQQTTDGGYIITGYTFSYGAGGTDAWLIYLNPNTPVLILPGIMESYSSYLFDPEGGNYTLTFNFLFWKWKTILSEEWVVDPILNSYQEMVDYFENSGQYTLDDNLFTVGYDWRKKCDDYSGGYNDDAGQAKLSEYIELAQNNSGSPNVDVITHGMGGLISRHHSEKSDYATDIRKFALVGVPNQGSVDTYYYWGGANYYKDTNWLDLEHWLIKYFMIPFMEDMKIGWGYESETDLTFVREMIPSTQQLLPTFDYLYNIDTGLIIPLTSMCDISKNNLTLLDNKLKRNIGSDNLHIFAGDNVSTLESLDVKTKAVHDCNTPPWEDGKPYTKNYDTEGDNTVLLDSASIPEIQVTTKTATHGQLTSAFKQEIYNFINAKASFPMDYSESYSEDTLDLDQLNSEQFEWFLFCGTRDKVQVYISTPEGSKVGSMNETYYKDNLCYLRYNEESTPALGLYELIPGDYILHVKPTQVGTSAPNSSYSLYITLRNLFTGEKQTQEISGTAAKAQEETYHILIDADYALSVISEN